MTTPSTCTFHVCHLLAYICVHTQLIPLYPSAHLFSTHTPFSTHSNTYSVHHHSLSGKRDSTILLPRVCSHPDSLFHAFSQPQLQLWVARS